MAGDARRRLRSAVLVVLALASAAPARAQDTSLFLVNDSTTVESLSFELQREAPWRENRFRDVMALRELGRGERLRGALSWLPLVKAPDPIPFDPVMLQSDVVRVRTFLAENGFPAAAVDYRVQLDSLVNSVAVTMTVDPGPPRILDEVRLQVAEEPEAGRLDGARLEAELNDEWGGRRLGDPELQHIQERAVAWARARGFSFVQADTRVVEGDDPFRVEAEVRLDPGPMTTVGGFRLENRSRLDSVTIVNHLLVQPGDTVRWSRLDGSAKQLEQLSIVNAALVQVMPDQPPGPNPQLRVLVVESKTRALSGRAGYADDRGLLAEGRIEHRNFLGGGRTLRASAQAETGIWSFENYPNELYGATLSLTQPRVGSPRLDLIPSISWSYEDGAREEARQLGADVTLVLRRGPNRFVSLTARAYERDVIQYRGLDVSDGLIDALERIEGLLGSSFRTSLTLAASWGTRDDLANPTRGWVVSGSLGVTGPEPWSDVQYVRGDLSGAWLHEFSPRGPRLLTRAQAGRLLPFGRSRNLEDDALASWLGLGGAIFTSGGVESVRGYATDLLGPKFPDLRVEFEPDTTVVAGDSWVPLGGLARWNLSAELQLPLGRTDHYGLIFLDGGRVYTPDPYFREEAALPLDLTDGAFYTLGGGMGFRTPVGALRLMVGYKLNPSPLDVRDAGSVLQELLDPDGDVTSLEANPWRRFRLHLSLGQPF